MNSLETDSHTVMSRSHYNENLLHNSELSTEHKTLSFFDEIVRYITHDSCAISVVPPFNRL